MTKKTKFQPCAVSDLDIGDVFTKDTKSRLAFVVVSISHDKVNAKPSGAFALHPTPFKKDKIVTYLRNSNDNETI